MSSGVRPQLSQITYCGMKLGFLMSVHVISQQVKLKTGHSCSKKQCRLMKTQPKKS